MPTIPTETQLAHAIAYIRDEFTLDDGRVTGEQWAEGLAFGQRRTIDADDRYQASAALPQLSDAKWREIAARAEWLRRNT
jgi:formylglycine-generating enzyme required for sulfatase activity